MATETKDTTHNGWTNYETWCVKLWLDNEEDSHNQLMDIVRHSPNDETASEAIRQLITYFSPLAEGNGMYHDLLRSALDNVNCDEIAKSVKQDIAPDNLDTLTLEDY